MHTHARLWCTVILMWFHLHARDPFVFIIIIRLEEADLLGLVETAMPLCLEIKNNFTAWMFVMSPQHRIGDIKTEIVLCTLKKSPFLLFSERGLKFWLMVLLTELLRECAYGVLFFVSILFNVEFMWQNANALSKLHHQTCPWPFVWIINMSYKYSLNEHAHSPL